MNKEEAFESIKTKMKDQKFLSKKIEKLSSEINDLCLGILKEEKGLEIGFEFIREKTHWNSAAYFKITKIEPHIYSVIGSEITYSLRGTPKKKDGEYSKREMFIKNISVYFPKGLKDE